MLRYSLLALSGISFYTAINPFRNRHRTKSISAKKEKEIANKFLSSSYIIVVVLYFAFIYFFYTETFSFGFDTENSIVPEIIAGCAIVANLGMAFRKKENVALRYGFATVNACVAIFFLLILEQAKLN